MTKKMGPPYTFKSIDVEVEEYIEVILENGGLFSGENNSIYYYFEHEMSDEGPQVIAVAKHTPQYIHLLQVPLQPTKRRKISIEPIINHKFLQRMNMLRH